MLPLAHLLTFNAYGTWLHGDERGSVDARATAFDTPRLTPNPAWNQYRGRQLKHPPVYFDAARRAAIQAAIQETCALRGWHLHAVAVRTNHVHVVVGIGDTPPDKAVSALKANGTRMMRERGCWNFNYTPWAEGGSTPYLWKERDVAGAVEYVLEGQGGDLD